MKWYLKTLENNGNEVVAPQSPENNSNELETSYCPENNGSEVLTPHSPENNANKVETSHCQRIMAVKC